VACGPDRRLANVLEVHPIRDPVSGRLCIKPISDVTADIEVF